MDPIVAAATLGISRALLKIVGHAVSGEASVAADVLEALGEIERSKRTEETVNELVSRYLAAHRHNPALVRHIGNEYDAIASEIRESITVASRPGFIASANFDSARILASIYRERGHDGNPDALLPHNAAVYRTMMGALVDALLAICEKAAGWKTLEAKRMHERFDELLDALRADARARYSINDALKLPIAAIEYIDSKECRDKQRFLDRYLRTVRSTLDRLELFGLDVDSRTHAKVQRLSAAYVTLLVVGEAESGRRGGAVTWPDLLDDLSKGQTGYLCVRADAGMGKTTLLRWTALAAGGGEIPFSDWRHGDSPRTYPNLYREDESETGRDSILEEREKDRVDRSWRHKIPLLISLRDCADGRLPLPSDMPAHLSRSLDRAPHDLIAELLDHGRAIVMIDGIDEIPSGPARTNAWGDIRAYINSYGGRGNIFIVTSRPIDDEPFSLESDASVAHVEPLSDAARDHLIKRWHHAYSAALPDSDGEAFSTKAARLIAEIENRPTLARLASNPLLCAMLCAQCGVLNYTLPDGEGPILEGLCHALLWRRDKERGIHSAEEVWNELSYPQRRELASRLACFMLKERAVVIANELADRKIEHALPGIGRDKTKAVVEAIGIRQTLSERGGLLRRTGNGGLEFVHNSLKEFLAASTFAQDWEFTFLTEHALQTDCSNVCRYIAGLPSAAEYTKRLINALLRIEEQGSAARRLLAVRMSAASPFLDPQLRQHIRDLEAGMFPPRSAAAATALAELGDDVVDRLQITPSMTASEQLLSAMALVRIGTSRARAALTRWVDFASTIDVVEQISRLVNPLLMAYVEERLAPPYGIGRGSLPRSVLQNITDDHVDEWLRTSVRNVDLCYLSLESTRISDAVARLLSESSSRLERLQTLNLSATHFGDSGLEVLAGSVPGLVGLTTLVLNSTKVTDAGLARLFEMEVQFSGTLTRLSLSGTAVSDAGIATLDGKQFRSLQHVWLPPHITDLSVYRLRLQFPNIQIHGVKHSEPPHVD